MSIVRKAYKSSKPQQLIKLSLGLDRLAIDPRDLVFALLGISDEPTAVNISYTDPVETILEAAAMLAINQGLVDLTLTAVQPSQRPTLASWAPD